MLKKDWDGYYEKRKDKAVSRLLLAALPYVKNTDHALDLGPGVLNDAKFLLRNKFKVHVVDKNPLVENFIKRVEDENLSYTIGSFEDFDYGKNKYDLINAQFSLPFIRKDNFEAVFINIIKSLKGNGVFCGQFFGVNDEWRGDAEMSFHTRQEVTDILRDLTVIHFQESEYDRQRNSGTDKHWHIFEVIIRRVGTYK